MSVTPMLDLPTVSASFGVGRSQTYKFIENKLLTPPVKIGKRSLWPAHEIEVLQKARIAGRPESELRELTKRLIEARVTAADQVAK